MMKQKKKKVIYDHFSSAGVRQRHDPQTMMQSGQKKILFLNYFLQALDRDTFRKIMMKKKN